MAQTLETTLFNESVWMNMNIYQNGAIHADFETVLDVIACCQIW
jgi:hypothetical protein